MSPAKGADRPHFSLKTGPPEATTESVGPRASWILTTALLFALGVFATPVHLLVDAHEWIHHENPEPDHHDHSHHEPHPAADHQIDPVAQTLRPTPVVIDIATVDLQILPPAVQSWTLTIEAEANRPPSSPESPPRCPRAPPV